MSTAGDRDQDHGPQLAGRLDKRAAWQTARSYVCIAVKRLFASTD